MGPQKEILEHHHGRNERPNTGDRIKRSISRVEIEAQTAEVR